MCDSYTTPYFCSVRIGFLVGAAPAIIGAASTAAIYIPSAVSTILRYRSGSFGSLRDSRFLVHRFAQDTPNILFGAAFWSVVASGAVFWVLIGGLAFLLVWDVSTVVHSMLDFLFARHDLTIFLLFYRPVAKLLTALLPTSLVQQLQCLSNW